LKARFLCKHKAGVEQFYTKLAKRDYQSDMALTYKKRFEKNRDKLFTFLAYDGVSCRASKNGQKGSIFLPRMWTAPPRSRCVLKPASISWCMTT
jgi:hypothetical protein